MFDSYKHFLETPGYHKIIGDDYLIVEFKCPIKEELFAAWSECHSIVYVLNGQKKWITPSDEFLVTERQSIFVRKGAFKNQQYFEDSFCVLMFFMKDDFIKRCLENDLNNQLTSMQRLDHLDFIYRINVGESLEVLFNSFFSYLKQPIQPPQKIIELKFREMIMNISLDPKNGGIKDVFHTLAAQCDDPIEKIMEEQFCYNLSINEYARLCGMSTSTFKRKFKQSYNSPPAKWLIKKRLALACELLLTTDFTIQQVCYECGFESDSHFIRSFKTAYGITPKNWRNSKKMAVG